MVLNDNFKISGERVFLRRFALTDTAKIFQMSIEEGMKRWIPDQVYQDENEAKEVLEFLVSQYDSPEGPIAVPVVLGVCLEETGELIGHAGLSPVGDEVEIGYAIEESQQRNGYASDAVAAFCKWAKNLYGLNHIMGIVASENAGSCRVLEKAGFEFIEEKERTMHGSLKLAKIYCF